MKKGGSRNVLAFSPFIRAFFLFFRTSSSPAAHRLMSHRQDLLCLSSISQRIIWAKEAYLHLSKMQIR
jgi:hypothetical protein